MQVHYVGCCACTRMHTSLRGITAMAKSTISSGIPRYRCMLKHCIPYTIRGGAVTNHAQALEMGLHCKLPQLGYPVADGVSNGLSSNSQLGPCSPKQPIIPGTGCIIQLSQRMCSALPPPPSALLLAVPVPVAACRALQAGLCCLQCWR